MKRLIILIFLLYCTLLYSNDAYIRTAGGAIQPFSESKSENISMTSEVITITLLEDHYHIDVYFDFYNNGITETIKVGFPEWRHLQPTDDKFSNFYTTVNGLPVDFIREKPFKPDILGDHIVVTQWYTREIIFPEKQVTKTSVSYDAPYGVYGIEESVDYLFGTANSWNGSIGTFTVNVINHSDYWFEYIKIGALKDYEVHITEFGYTVTLENVLPQNDSCIFIVVNRVPYVLVSLRRINFERNWYLNKQIINEDDIKLYTKQQLRILRNLIFAGHGHIFESPDLNEWLSKYAADWYKPLKKVDISELSEIEIKNLEIIQNEEKKR